MSTNMQGHNHGGKNHLLGMLGIGGVVLVVLLGTGRSFQQALPYAIFLACPLMMVGMMYMMRGNKGQHQGQDTTNQGSDGAPVNNQNSHSTSSSQYSKSANPR